MRTSKTNYLVVFFVVLSLGVVAGPVWSQELKLGYVTMPEVLDKSPQAQSAQKRLEHEFAPRQRQIVADQKKIRQLEDKLVTDSAIMSESERGKMDRNIRALKRDLKRTQDEYREDLNIRRNEELAKLQKLVVDAIQVIAKEGKFDLVVADPVLFASQRVNITSLVLEKLKKDYSTNSSPVKP